MKLKEGFILQTVAGQTVVLPDMGAVNMDMMITLNDTGRFLWERMTRETDVDTLVAALLEEYEVQPEQARSAVEGFIDKLKGHDLLA